MSGVSRIEFSSLRRCWEGLMLLCLAALLLTVTNGLGAAAETIKVRGGVHPNFARIVFDTPPEAAFKVQAERDSVIVRFEVGSEYDLTAAQKALFRYIGPGKVSAEGREVRFPFKRAFDVRSARIDGKVVIDLYRLSAERPRIRVRAGEHPTYSRVVFDWTKPVAARLEQSGGQATVVFDQGADFALEPVQRRLPKGITGLSLPKSDKGSRVAVQAAANSTFRLFRDGNKVVLDVTRPANEQTAEIPKSQPEPAAAKAPEKLKATEPAQKDPGAQEAGGRPAPAIQKPTSLLPKTSEVEPAETTEPPAAASAQGAIERQLEQEDKKAASADARALAQAQALVAAQAQASEDADNATGPVRFATPESIRAAVAAERAGEPIPEDNLITLDAFRTELNVEAALAEGDDVGGEAKLVMLTDDPDLPQFTPAPGKTPEPIDPTVLKFGWDRATGAAAFQRGNRLWLVFDRLGPFDLVRQLRRIAPHLEPIDRVAVQRGTAVRLTLPPLFAPRLAFKDNVWTVDIRRRVPLPEDSVSVSVKDTPKGPEVIFSRGEARTLLSIADPDLNDRIVVAPVRVPGLGVASAQQFAQFRALVSYQGVVLQPTAEGLAMGLEARGVIVSGREPLQVSDADARALPTSGERNRIPGGSMFDLERARRGLDEDFTANKQELQRDLLSKDGNNVGIARLDLARFYFGHGRAPEALAMLRLLDAENPALAADPEVVMMKGVSHFLTDNFDEAARDLAHPALVGEREAVLWQSALAAKDQDWEAAATGFAETDDLIDQYARPVRHRLRLLEAEASLATGDTGGGSLQLRKIEADEPTEAALAQVGYLRGQRLLLDGEEEEAEKLWRQITRNRHRPSSARARLALLERGLETGSVTAEEAIDELENLRFAWRGDKFEFALLRRLGDLYLADGDYREGLKSLRQAASHFPSSKRSEEVTRRMQQEFKDLYLTEKGQDVQAVTAVALYEEYKELTPPGEEGDAIITKLADRLVEVDLLERAGDLLKDQVDYRLKGEEKAKVAARAALIRLLERKPEDALQLLEESEMAELPKGLTQQRRHLKARALAEASREAEALALLEDDTASDALQLRAEILWKQRNWKDAGLALARLVPAEPPKRELSNKEALAVLNLAVALTLADDRTALELLAESYRDSMDETPQAESFALLSGDLIGNDVKSITEELAQIGQIQDFVTSYRQQLNSTQLSELE